MYTATTHALDVEERDWVTMKKALAAILVALSLTILFTTAALAGGDQVRGDKGQGAVHQVQVQDPPPFQP